MNDRTKIASEQLAALVIRGASAGWNQSHDGMASEAIRLADLLLSKLESSAPVATDSLTDKSRLLGKLPSSSWQCLSFAKPERYQPCWVVVWDSGGGQVKSIDRLYWDGGMWEDGGGDCALGDVPDLSIYWCPSHLLPNSDGAIRISFIEFIESR